MVFSDSFADAFWPAFLATVGGVILGIPIGLALARFGVNVQRRAEREERKTRRALVAVREAVTWNGTAADRLAADVTAGQIPFVTELETARWEAVREEFVTLVEDAELQGRVGYFFSNVQTCARIAELYFEFAAGVASTLSHSGGLFKRLQDELRQELPALSFAANELDTVLEEKEKQVASS